VFSLCLLAVIADFFLIARSPAYVLYLGVFAACMLPAIGFYFFRPLGNALRRGVMKLRPLSLDRRASAILDHLSPFKGQRRLVTELVLFSAFIQALRVVTHVLVGMALGIALDASVLCQFFVFIPLLSLAMIPHHDQRARHPRGTRHRPVLGRRDRASADLRDGISDLHHLGGGELGRPGLLCRPARRQRWFSRLIDERGFG
jgi:hypothetical protein